MSLQSFNEAVSKAIGDDAVARYDDPSSFPHIERIPSGSFDLDDILGGGWPMGRMVEIFGKESSGKSTLALEAIASMQRARDKNQFALFVDTEHAVDFSYAKNLGIDMSKVYFSQPNGANEALKIILESVRHNAHRMIILDSAAALVTEDQLQADPGDSSAKAAVARLLAIELPKIISRLTIADCCLIVLNQVRERPGMMFGCLHGDTLVNFSDGRSIPIRKVVKEKIQGNVYSFNPETEAIEERPITAWHDNGLSDRHDWIQFKTYGIGTTNGVKCFTVTKNHEILTKEGWKRAYEIDYSDQIASSCDIHTGHHYLSVMSGICSGDCTDRQGRLSISDKDNQQYLEWKKALLEHCQFTGFTPYLNGYIAQANNSFKYWKKQYPKRSLKFLADHGTELSLAIWYMDDGHLRHEESRASRVTISYRKTRKHEDKYVKAFLNRLGIDCSIWQECVWIKNPSKFFDLIGRYIVPSMRYKCEGFNAPEYDFHLNELYIGQPERILTYDEIKDISEISDKKARSLRKYDISVAGTKNYSVGTNSGYGCIVHNSPEYAPGGNALGFYASIILRLQKIGQPEEEKGVNVSSKTKAVTKKNKTYPPFKECEFMIRYGVGIDKVDAMLEKALELGIFIKKGSWYKSPKGNNLAQGKEAMMLYLQDKQDKLRQSIYGKLK